MTIDIVYREATQMASEKDQIRQELIQFLSSRFPALPNEISEDTPLTDSGAIDSLGILDVVGFLDEKFNVEINDHDFQPENFETLGSLARLVAAKLDRT